MYKIVLNHYRAVPFYLKNVKNCAETRKKYRKAKKDSKKTGHLTAVKCQNVKMLRIYLNRWCVKLRKLSVSLTSFNLCD